MRVLVGMKMGHKEGQKGVIVKKITDEENTCNEKVN